MTLTAAAQRRLRERTRALAKKKKDETGAATPCRAVPAAAGIERGPPSVAKPSEEQDAARQQDGAQSVDGAIPGQPSSLTFFGPPTLERQPLRRPSNRHTPPPAPPIHFVTVERKVSFGSASSVVLLNALATSPPSDVNVGRLRPSARPGRSRSCLRATPRWSPRFSAAIPECGGVLGCVRGGPGPYDEERQHADDRNVCERVADCLILECKWIAGCCTAFFGSAAGCCTAFFGCAPVLPRDLNELNKLQDLLFNEVDAGTSKGDGNSPQEESALEEIEVLSLCSENLRSTQVSPSVPLRKCSSTPLAALRKEMRSAGFREVLL